MRLASRADSHVLLALTVALASVWPARGVSTTDMKKCHAELGFEIHISEILNCGVDIRHYVECLDTTHCQQGTPEYNDALLEFRGLCCKDDITCGHESFNELCGSRDFGGESVLWRIALITVTSCLGVGLLCLCCSYGVSGAWRDVLWQGKSGFVSCSNWCTACCGYGPPPPPPYAKQRQPLMQPAQPLNYAYAVPPANPALPAQWFPSLTPPVSASLVYAPAPGQPMPYPQRGSAPPYAEPPPVYARPPPLPMLPPQPMPPMQYAQPPQVCASPQINTQAMYLGQPMQPQLPQPAYSQASAQRPIFMPR